MASPREDLGPDSTNPRDSPRGLCGESPTAERRDRGENAESLEARGDVRPPTFRDSVKWGQAVRLLPQKSFLYSSGRGKSRARPEIDIRRNRECGGRPTPARRTTELVQVLKLCRSPQARASRAYGSFQRPGINNRVAVNCPSISKNALCRNLARYRRQVITKT